MKGLITVNFTHLKILYLMVIFFHSRPTGYYIRYIYINKVKLLVTWTASCSLILICITELTLCAK